LRANINGHAKRANLILLWHPGDVLGKTNKQHHSKELEKGFSVLFFSFSTALVIEKIEFEISSHIPTCDYINRLLATTGPSVGIQILKIPTASQEILNGHSMCYKYPPELKPSAK
jgi:hypothetical protein